MKPRSKASLISQHFIMTIVFLAGASRGLGFEVARVLSQQQTPTIALLRSSESQSQLEALNIQVKFGDAMNEVELATAMTGQSIDTVISTIGGTSLEGVRSDFIGNRNLIDAAVEAGVKHFILITSIGAGTSSNAIPASALEALGAVLIEKEQAETYLHQSGLAHTVIRPGGLKSEPATGNAVLTADSTIGGIIHRADVAKLICKCIGNDRTHNQTLSAVDKAMVYGDRTFEAFAL